MKPVKVDLSSDIKQLEVLIFADEHIGDAHCDMAYLKQRIDYVQSHPNAYCILGGDLMDNATKTSIGDIYKQTKNPTEQIDEIVELFKPIKKKILCAVKGNHEHRTYKKEGIDPMRCVCDRLNCASKYSETGVVLFLRFGHDVANGAKRKVSYTFYITHGSGGGRKEGAKAIRLAELSSIVDTDIYIHNHTHLPMVMKEDYIRVNRSTSTITPVTKLFVNSSGNLTYGGYGETLGCKPASIAKPKIILSGTSKEFKSLL